MPSTLKCIPLTCSITILDVNAVNRLTDSDRKEILRNIKFPSSLKGMQSFLGMAVFFNTHVPGYARLVAHLCDMTKKDFDWKIGIISISAY